MARSVRVLLTPVPFPTSVDSASSSNSVTGVQLTLAQLATGGSRARVDQELPAELGFHLHLYDRARNASPTRTTKIATLTGTLSLRGSEATPVFLNGQDEDGNPNTLQYVDPALQEAVTDDEATDDEDENNGQPSAAESDDPSEAEPSAKAPRMLDLDLNGQGFEGTRDVEGYNGRLLLPDDVNDFHFAELEVELTIQGATEQALGVSDRLDLRITETAPPFAPCFTLQLFDEVGQPLDGVAIRFERGPRVRQRVTDSDGFARLLASGADSTAIATVVDPEALKATLKARWQEPRGKPMVAVGPDVQVVEPTDLKDGFEIAGDTPLHVCIRPHVVLARLLSMFFDTNKSFLLPSILPTVGQLKSLFDDNPNCNLLIVGHADTTADANVNDSLSLDRAKMVAAYLTDNVDPWLRQYHGSRAAQRWGSVEDSLMIQSLPDFGTKPVNEDSVRWFQRTRSLVVDGEAGDKTRTQLITEYMGLDGTPLPSSIPLVTHGAGENFPLDATGQDLDQDPPDASADQLDRRVELFFFDQEFGIQPAPPGPNSKPGSQQYPEWRRRAGFVDEFDGTLPRLLSLRLLFNGQPLASTAVRVFIDGVLDASINTDANALLEFPIAPDAQTAQIEIVSSKLRLELSLVEPPDFPNINSLRGAQQRLAQLGFYFGAVNGVGGPATDSAVLQFKQANGLAPDSVLDSPTRQSIVAQYGS